jgi:lactam utilization protein B
MHKKVHTLQDEIIKLPVDTICIHGDGFHAVEMAKAIYTKLKEQNIEIKYPQ